MENLGRGVVAVRTSPAEVFVGWRVLGTDPPDVAFNLYRSTAAARPVKLNATPLTRSDATTSTPRPTSPGQRVLRPARRGGVEEAPSASFTLPRERAGPAVPARARSSSRPAAPRRTARPTPTAPTTPASATSTATASTRSSSSGIRPTRKDNSQAGYTGNVYLDAYKLDGTRLWRINLGRNIREGAHYTQFMVYDLDGDGRGRGRVQDRRRHGRTARGQRHRRRRAPTTATPTGYVLTGPEFLTVFDGATGAALATRRPTSCPAAATSARLGRRLRQPRRPLPRRASPTSTASARASSWRRGYYTRAVLAAWDWRDGKLTQRWTFDSDDTGTPATAPTAARAITTSASATSTATARTRSSTAPLRSTTTARASTPPASATATRCTVATSTPTARAWRCSTVARERPAPTAPTRASCRDAAHRRGALAACTGGATAGRGVAVDIDPRYRGYEMLGPPAADTRGCPANAKAAQQDLDRTSRAVQLRHLVGRRPAARAARRHRRSPSGTGTAGDRRTLLAGARGHAPRTTAPRPRPALRADILGDWREEVDLARRPTTRRCASTRRRSRRTHRLLHADARPAIPLGDRLAELGVQPAAAPELLPRRRHGAAAGARTSSPRCARCSAPPRPASPPITEDTGASASDFVTADTTLVLGRHRSPRTRPSPSPASASA